MPGMMNLDNPEYFAEQEEIKRRQYVAQLLQKKALDSGGGMPTAPGGRVARRSPFEGMAQVMAGYMSGKASEDASAQAKALRERMQGDRSSDMGMLARVLRGTPATSETIIDEQAAGGMGAPATINAPAVAPRQIDESVLSQMRSPRGQQLAETLWMTQMQPKAPIKAGPGDQLIDPTTFKPVYSVPPKPDKPPAVPSAIQEYEYAQKQGFKGSFQDFQLQQRKAGASNVSVDARTERKYGEQFAGQIAKADSDMRDAALKAPELAERSNRIKETLASGKVTTGFGADYRLAFGKAVGLAGASDAETLKNTETLVAELASNTMDAIKASGMGGGTGFSNADRDFLEKAKGGKITLEASTINRLADLSHKAAALSADRWNKRVKQIPKSALEGTGIPQDDVKVPGLFAGGKQAIYAVNPQTKQRIMSTDGGNTWGPAQ